MSYVIGVDLGTLSARAVLVDIRDGRIVAQSTYNFEHGVLEKNLPTGIRIKEGSALAVPDDYLTATCETIREVVKLSEIEPQSISAIGLDVTASTFLPVDDHGRPLCENGIFADEPHAWMKLWKHHGAMKHAERMTETARTRKEAFLPRCGGRINAEWMLPKILEIYEEAPDVTQAADCFMEAGDWLVRMLTGIHTRNACAAGYKTLAFEGLTDEYLDAVSAGFASVIADKLKGKLILNGSSAGGLSKEMAQRLRLRPGTIVAVANVDAHAAAPAAGMTGAGEMVMILGTSCCAMLCAEEEREVPGVFGMVRDGILPGFVGYEAGQSCVGDLYDWYLSTLPDSCTHDTLTAEASKLKPGESGLLALDWFNGNRSCLADAELSGLIVGMTLHTTPAEIYRALIESTAFGMRKIIDCFEQSGVAVNRLIACGGIATKNQLLLQIYADITGREVSVATTQQASAFGSVLCAATAAGIFPSIVAAAKTLGHLEERTYRPLPEHRAVYDRLYAEYARLHDCFGKGENNVMKVLRRLKDEKTDYTGGH